MPTLSSEGILDASISFGRRTTTRLPQESKSSKEYKSEQYDFLALMTAIAELYSQEGILEMQCRRGTGKPFAHGAVSEVSRIYAAVTKPSTVVSHQVKRRNHVVVLKKSEAKLFLPSGQHNDTSAIRSFISEIRILSHKPVREHSNIIKLLGIHWDYFETVGTQGTGGRASGWPLTPVLQGYPEPLLLLEKANTDLATFQSRHRSLPFETKKSISLDIARGLSALHQSGVIHGDLKPQNVLIFNKPALHAKVADFSHSLLDTGETGNLVGGTWVYSAPEWKKSAPTVELLKTDIYSYGLVFGGLILGSELVSNVQQHPPFDLHVSTEEAIQKLKEGDHMKEYLFRLVHNTDQENPDSDLDEFPLIYKVFENTVQLDPKTRNLDGVLGLLGDRRTQTQGTQRIDQSLASNAISIPYHALQGLSPILIDQVVRSLRSVAASQRDTRRAAAWMELAVCHACDISWSNESEVPTNSGATALSAMLSAADLGDVWARAVVHRVSKALREDITARYAIKSWLFDAASKGSRIALDSLLDLDHIQAREALRIYRTTFCGNPDQLYLSIEMKPDYLRNPGLIINARKDTVLHWVASTGNEAIFKAFPSSSLDVFVVNSQNDRGDTPILCAARAGHFNILAMLISRNANASLTNSFSENALHFLTNLDNEDIPTAAQLLVGAGAELDAEAIGNSGNSYLEPNPRGKSCPRLRAIFANNPLALRSLLDLTTDALPVSTARRGIPLSSQKYMLAWALRLHHFEILEVLGKYFRNTRLFNSLSETYVWNSGRRYSLPALCILGCVSGSPLSGFDVPEQFFRILNHGKDCTRNLEKSLLFLSSHEPSIFTKPCHDARNALFYAIKEGRGDAVRFLAAHEQPPGLDTLFNSPYNRWARCNEISGLLNRIEKRAEEGKSRDEYKRPLTVPGSKGTKRRQTPAAARREGNAHSPIPTPDGRDMSYPGSSEESDSSYEHPDGDSDSNIDEVYVCPHYISQLYSRDLNRRDFGRPHGHSFTRAVRRTSIFGPPFVLTGQPGNYIPCNNLGDGLNDATEYGPRLPFNYQAMEGVVDAVLMSILYGRRKIFHDLVTGVAKKTMQPPPPFPCFVSANPHSLLHYDNESVEEMAHAHTPNNLIRHFPTQVWRSCLTTNDPDPEESEPFDGILRYPLLYMTAIAGSIHRDMFLAKTLLLIMRKMNVPEPKEWAAGSYFESECLSIDSTVAHTTPLYHAAHLRWDELAILLMEHGATPQGKCWGGGGASHNVLSQLCVVTNNANSEVRNLLTMASSLNIDQIITLNDISMLFGPYPSSEDLVQWKNGILSWNNYYQSPPVHYIQLWSAVEAANISQRQKIRAEWPSSLVVDAAQRRDIVALQHLLDFGLNVNEKTVSRTISPSFIRATALDRVSWTATVKPTRCSDSGLQLKEHDAQIAEFLISRGAIRGPDYVFEYLLSIAVLQCIVIPIGGPVLLCFLVYLFGSKAMDLVTQSWSIRETTLNGNPREFVIHNFALLFFMLGWMFDLLCPMGIWAMWDYITERREQGHQKSFTPKAAMACGSFFALAVANFMARSTVATGGRTGEAFILDILSDLCVSGGWVCGLALTCIPNIVLASLLLNHPSSLCQEVQECSPSDVVWGATRSVLRPRIYQWRAGLLERFPRLRDWLYFDVRMPSMERRRDTLVGEWEPEGDTRLLDHFSDSE